MNVDMNIKIISIFIFSFIFYIGYLSASKRYVSRNRRLYINFIENKGKNETETKVKYVRLKCYE